MACPALCITLAREDEAVGIATEHRFLESVRPSQTRTLCDISPFTGDFWVVTVPWWGAMLLDPNLLPSLEDICAKMRPPCVSQTPPHGTSANKNMTIGASFFLGRISSQSIQHISATTKNQEKIKYPRSIYTRRS